jgi:EAL domain-containing protein (putative c-di-GMP-specific phosphodiesterase class I)
MEAGVGVTSPEFLQKKIGRLKTALDEANVLMDRQVAERDEARAQLDGLKRQNEELKRQIADGQGTASAASESPGIDPALEAELRERIADLERDSLQASPSHEGHQLQERVAALQRDLDGARDDLEESRRETDASRRDAEAARHDADDARRDAEAARHDADAARRDTEAARSATEAAREDAEAARRDTEAARHDADAARSATEAARQDADAARGDADDARVAAAAAETVPALAGHRTPADTDLLAPGPFVSHEVIRDALENDNFVLFCQPVFSLQAERITQYELLLRLRDPHGRLVRPFAFLEPADRYGLMAEIDRWVVEHALELLARDSSGDLRLEVNLAGQSLGDPELTAIIEQQIAMTDLDPARLILEVSENVAVANLEDCKRLAKRLRGLGCGFALDDFGSTFASFRHLRDLPINFLKIDGDLVATVTESRTGQLTIKSLVELAKGLGAETVAEYVSDDQTLEFLREQGVGYAQGYRIGRPRPIEEVLVTHAADQPRPQLAARVEHAAIATGYDEFGESFAGAQDASERFHEPSGTAVTPSETI